MVDVKDLPTPHETLPGCLTDVVEQIRQAFSDPCMPRNLATKNALEALLAIQMLPDDEFIDHAVSAMHYADNDFFQRIQRSGAKVVHAMYVPTSGLGPAHVIVKKSIVDANPQADFFIELLGEEVGHAMHTTSTQRLSAIPDGSRLLSPFKTKADLTADFSDRMQNQYGLTERAIEEDSIMGTMTGFKTEWGIEDQEPVPAVYVPQRIFEEFRAATIQAILSVIITAKRLYPGTSLSAGDRFERTYDAMMRAMPHLQRRSALTVGFAFLGDCLTHERNIKDGVRKLIDNLGTKNIEQFFNTLPRDIQPKFDQYLAAAGNLYYADKGGLPNDAK